MSDVVVQKKLCPFQGGIFAVPNRINPHAAQITFISGPCLGGKCVMHGTEDEGCLLVRRSILVDCDRGIGDVICGEEGPG